MNLAQGLGINTIPIEEIASGPTPPDPFAVYDPENAVYEIAGVGVAETDFFNQMSATGGNYEIIAGVGRFFGITAGSSASTSSVWTADLQAQINLAVGFTPVFDITTVSADPYDADHTASFLLDLIDSPTTYTIRQYLTSGWPANPYSSIFEIYAGIAHQRQSFPPRSLGRFKSALSISPDLISASMRGSDVLSFVPAVGKYDLISRLRILSAVSSTTSNFTIHSIKFYPLITDDALLKQLST